MPKIKLTATRRASALIASVVAASVSGYVAIFPGRAPVPEDVALAIRIMQPWEEVFLNAVARPSAATGVKYNEVSSLFWSAVHKTLSGNGKAAENLEELSVDLETLKADSW